MSRHFSFILFAVLITACNHTEEAQEQPQKAQRPSDAFYVKTAPVVLDKLEDVLRVTGVVESETDARPAFKTGGVVAKTFVEEGDRVHKGQLLAQLNLTEIQAQATQAQFALDKARRDNQRLQNLYADSIVTLEQLQNSQTAVEVAEKSVQIADFNVNYSEVRSPIDGKVISQLLHTGEIAAPGLPVYYIMGVQATDWKLVAGLSDRYWARVKPGDSVSIAIDAYPDVSLVGVITRLSDVANPMSGTFNAEISIPAKGLRLAAGMLAHLEIRPAPSREFPFIPIEALVSSSGNAGVVYIADAGRAVRRNIHIQEFLGERVAVQSGISVDDAVITAGSGFLENGDAIIIE